MNRKNAFEYSGRLDALEQQFEHIFNHPYFDNTTLAKQHIREFNRDAFLNRVDISRALDLFELKLARALEEISEFEKKSQEKQSHAKKSWFSAKRSRRTQPTHAIDLAAGVRTDTHYHQSLHRRVQNHAHFFVFSYINKFLIALGRLIFDIGYITFLPLTLIKHISFCKTRQNHRVVQKKIKPDRAPHFTMHNFIHPHVKTIAGYIAISLVVTAPIQALGIAGHTKQEVLMNTERAITELKNISSSSETVDLQKLSDTLENAHTYFAKAQSSFNDAGLIADALSRFTPQGDTADMLLEIGTQLTLAGADIADALSQFTQGNILDAGLALTPSTLPFEGLAQASHSAPSSNLINKIQSLEESLARVRPRIALASQHASEINASHVPRQAEPYWEQFQIILPLMQKTTSELVDILGHIKILLGADQTHRALIVFQNNTELRPTGGFLGSFALVDIDRGVIKHIEIPGGGLYDLQGQLSANVAAPQPLWVVNPRWQFHDANWFPDFPSSAKKIAWFYEKSGGPTVDEVIAINATLMQKLLAITGPVELPEFGITVTHDNFFDVVQKEVEENYDIQENMPKKIIAVMTPLVIQRILDAEPKQFIDLFALLSKSLVTRDIQLYSRHETLQPWLIQQGWAGSIKSAPQDYLMVVDANIAGGKSNATITQNIQQETVIQHDGSLISTVTIERSHQTVPEQTFSFVRNLSYLRLYVPEGSALINTQKDIQTGKILFKVPEQELTPDADLLEYEKNPLISERTDVRITQEWGKTVFGAYLWLNPGETKKIIFSYKLPFTLRSDTGTPRYSILIQKQSGMMNTTVSSMLRSSNGAINIYWKKASEGALHTTPYSIKLTQPLEKDIAWGTVFTY
ncbi:MAG TPA: DUF4012 domain-containing protein [Patescibacteria group bacterium]|nr:DUF4012 domain-containing protein [Patescibacteria group bacterium]